VADVTFSPDGRSLAAVTMDGIVRLWDLATGRRRDLAGHRAVVWSVRFSPDGTLLVSSSMDRTTRVWTVATGECRILDRADGMLGGPAFAPDSRRLLTHVDGVRLWDLASGESRPLPLVGGAEFLPDGRHVVGIDASGQVLVVPDDLPEEPARLAAMAAAATSQRPALR
jgi:hypothetical protein